MNKLITLFAIAFVLQSCSDPTEQDKIFTTAIEQAGIMGFSFIPDQWERETNHSDFRSDYLIGRECVWVWGHVQERTAMVRFTVDEGEFISEIHACECDSFRVEDGIFKGCNGCNHAFITNYEE